MWKCGINLAVRNTKVYKRRKIHRTIFSTVFNIFQPKSTILLNWVLFLAVLINFQNSKDSLIGNGSIAADFLPRLLLLHEMWQTLYTNK